MNKTLKFVKRRIFCINSRTDREIFNLSQFSPRVTRSKSKKQENVAAECQQTRADDDSQKKTRSVGRAKAKKKNKRKPGEADSLQASRGSLGTASLIQTPRPSYVFSPLAPYHLPLPLDASLSLRPSTVSSGTPQRCARFHRDKVVEGKPRVLGKGSFSTIIQATYKGELVAAKIVPPHRSASLKNELNNFLLLHPNIVKTLRIISNEENYSCGLVIMETYSSITLEHLSDEESYSLDEKTVVRFMVDVGNALDYCHKQRVLHLDVKPQNILVNIKTKVCKLCDFGSSSLFLGDEAFVQEYPDYKAMESTVVYTSPELLSGERPTEKSDVYSLGITIWQLVHREKPYRSDNKLDLQATITKIVKQRKRPQKKKQTVTNLEKLYTKCWEHEPEKRPSMKDVVHFLTNTVL